MSTIFGLPVAVILGQLTLGLVNGSFYALLSLGLAVIFGLLGIVNFAPVSYTHLTLPTILRV